MSLSQRKLATYQKYFCTKLSPLHEFDPGDGHTVVLFTQQSFDREGERSSFRLMCPCDLHWKWEYHQGKKRMIALGDAYNCLAKEAFRVSWRARLVLQHGADWKSMTLADALHDIFVRARRGEYMGEHNPGMLYVQDCETLLGTTPRRIELQPLATQDLPKDVLVPRQVTSLLLPSREILAACQELTKRKLVQLSGMILVPYQESFRFPAVMHHTFAQMIEEPLGWPNGDAGDIFLHDLMKKIALQTGWQKGEDVFGPENTPELEPKWRVVFKEKWLAALHPSLIDPQVLDKGRVLAYIPIDQWVRWLTSITAEITAA